MSLNRRRVDSDADRYADQQNETPRRNTSGRYHDDDDGSDSSARYSSNEYLQTDERADIIRHASPEPPPKPTPRRDIHWQSKETQTAKTRAGQDAQFLRSLYFVVFIFGILTMFLYFTFGSNENQIKKCSFEQLEKKYPQQNKRTWKKVRNGIENVLNKRIKSPAVLLLSHQGSGNTRQLIEDIVQNSRDCFGEKETIKLPLDLFISKETASDYGNVIAYFNEKIKKGKVVLIANLNEIPAQAALSLHPICDTHMPVSHEAIIFMTLVTPTTSDPPRNIAFDTLRGLWSELNNDDLMPLLARITDDVIQLEDLEI